MADTAQERAYLPAMRFNALTPLFDLVVRAVAREGALRDRLLDQAAIAPGHRVLDVGCGTGTLAVEAKRRVPDAHLVGLDPDPAILARAEKKAAGANVDLTLERGFADELPFEDASFDRVLSTLVFHHLDPQVKRGAAREIARVLRPGGELHVADYGRPSNPAMWVLSRQIRAFDGHSTVENFAGRLPEIFAAAGLRDARERSRLHTPTGTLALYSAGAP